MFSVANLSAQAALSAIPPMVVSAMTHSMGSPLAWRTLLLMSSAAAFAMFMVWTSRLSRIPNCLPSMTGLIPIFDNIGTVPFRFLR